jgi:hypothetical protein
MLELSSLPDFANNANATIKVGKVSIEAFCVDVEGESSRAQKEDSKPNTSSEAGENIKIRIRKLRLPHSERCPWSLSNQFYAGLAAV